MTAAHTLRLQPPGTPEPLALVTGAGRAAGIGRAICARLEQAGMRVVATRAPAEPDDGFPAMAVDLADPAAPAALMDRVVAEHGRPPTVLVNNAAHSERAGWEALDAAGLDAHYAVNLRA